MTPFLKKAKQFLHSITICLLALPCVGVSAAENASTTSSVFSVPTTEVQVNQETGEFSFEMQVNSPDNYAGMEFGVICAGGCEITSVSCDMEASVTGPKEANGLVWFGFFAGEDKFSGTAAVTVSGTCEKGIDSAVSIQDVKKYTIGDRNYDTEQIDSSNVIVNLRSGVTAETNEQNSAEEVGNPETNGINAMQLIVSGLVIAALAAAALIYMVRRKSPKA